MGHQHQLQRLNLPASNFHQVSISRDIYVQSFLPKVSWWVCLEVCPTAWCQEGRFPPSRSSASVNCTFSSLPPSPSLLPQPRGLPFTWSQFIGLLELLSLLLNLVSHLAAINNPPQLTSTALDFLPLLSLFSVQATLAFVANKKLLQSRGFLSRH